MTVGFSTIYIAQRPDRYHGAKTTLGKAIVVAAGEQFARLDGVDGFLGAVDADHLGLAVGSVERFDGADRHGVIGGEHPVDLRIELHQVFHHLQCLQALIVAGLRRQQLGSRVLFQRVVCAISSNSNSVSRSESAAVGSSMTRMRAFWR